MPFVLADSTEGTNTHLVRTTEQLQALLVLRADFTVQVPQYVHQLVPLERGRLVVRLQVFLAVRGEAVEARLDSLEFFTSAVVASDVSVAGVASVAGGHQIEVQACLLDLLGNFGEGGVGSQHGSLGERDPTLRAYVDACVVSFVPVSANTVHAEAVAAWNRHRVPQ